MGVLQLPQIPQTAQILAQEMRHVLPPFLQPLLGVIWIHVSLKVQDNH